MSTSAITSACAMGVIAICAALASACGDDDLATRIDAIVIEVPPGLPQDPDSLSLRVNRLADGAETLVIDESIAPTPGDDGAFRPWTTSTSPIDALDPGRTLYRFRATATIEGRDVVSAQHRIVFVPGTRVTLPLRLYARCVDRPCRTGFTCVDGACVDEFVPACSLLDDPSTPFCEGSAPSDPSPVVRIAAGDITVCALRASGRVACWGYLSPMSERTPRVMPAPEPITRIAIGPGVPCGITRSGAVLCWGLLGLTGAYPQPSQIDGFPPAREIVMLSELVDGGRATQPVLCVLTTSDDVWCARGGLPPMPVEGVPGPISELVGGGGEACVLTTSGDVHCWVPPELGPDATPESTGVREVEVGSGGRCVIANDGSLSCVPVHLASEAIARTEGPGLDGVTVGTRHACARRIATGEVVCWGYGQLGGLGDGSFTDRISPASTTAIGVTSPLQIEAGQEMGCALDSSGAVQCWGLNTNGEIGNGSEETAPLPVRLAL